MSIVLETVDRACLGRLPLHKRNSTCDGPARWRWQTADGTESHRQRLVVPASGRGWHDGKDRARSKNDTPRQRGSAPHEGLTMQSRLRESSTAEPEHGARGSHPRTPQPCKLHAVAQSTHRDVILHARPLDFLLRNCFFRESQSPCEPRLRYNRYRTARTLHLLRIP